MLDDTNSPPKQKPNHIIADPEGRAAMGISARKLGTTALHCICRALFWIASLGHVPWELSPPPQTAQLLVGTTPPSALGVSRRAIQLPSAHLGALMPQQQAGSRAKPQVSMTFPVPRPICVPKPSPRPIPLILCWGGFLFPVWLGHRVDLVNIENSRIRWGAGG